MTFEELEGEDRAEVEDLIAEGVLEVPTQLNCTYTHQGERMNSNSNFHLFADVLLAPYSKSACAWVAEHIPDDTMWFGSSIVVEHRYVAALVAQIERDGLVVSRG